MCIRDRIIAGADEQVIESTRKLESIRVFEQQMMLKLKAFLRSQLEALENGLLLDKAEHIEPQGEQLNVNQDDSGN